MVTEPTWLHVAGQIAGTVLLVELWLVMLIACALMVGLWLAMRWVRLHLVPVVDHYGEQARDALSVAVRGGDRIVQGVAEIHGREEAIRAAVATFLLGPGHAGANGHQKLRALPPSQASFLPRGDADEPLSQ
jgi:hypothetical protein